MLDRPVFFSTPLRALGSIVLGLTIAACGGPTQPTVVIPPTDPPTISCPAASTASSTDGSPVPVSYNDPVVAGGQSPFTLACTPVSGSSFGVGTTPVSCTVTDAQQRTANCTFAVTVAIPPKPKLTLTAFAAFGDSITWGENGLASLTSSSAQRSGFVHPEVQFPSFETYPGVLQSELVARYTTQSPIVDNYGLPGEAVLDPGTQTRFSNMLAGGRYTVVLIMEGANDLANRDATVEPAVISGLRQMILDAKSLGVAPYLATIPPEQHGCCPDRGLASGLVPAFDDQVRALSLEQAIPLVDVYAALAGDVGTYIGPDGLHPTTQGYAKIADTFFGVIKQTLEAQATLTQSKTTRSLPRAGASAPAGRAPQATARKPR